MRSWNGSFWFLLCSFVLFAPASPAANTPAESEVTEVRVSFEQAENEVLTRFRRDLPRIEALTDKLSIYEVTGSGDLPTNYNESLRSKLGRLILTSKQIHLIDCAQCQVSRLVKDAEGKLRYESFSDEAGRPAKIAGDLGVKDLLYADLQYTPNDVRLRVRLVNAASQEVLFTGEYATADLVRDRGKIVDREYEYKVGELGRGDSLSQVIIGEIAFAMTFSPGLLWIPTIDEGQGSSRMFYPSADILIGEKFDSGHKRFGFVFGAAANAAEGSAVGKPLPYVIRVAPQYRYTFNPYNVSSGRFSITTEIGGLISSGMVTAYAGIGPEVNLVKRFSLSMMPIFILPTTVKGGQLIVPGNNGQLNAQAQPDQGKFGGFSLLIKGSMNW